MNFTFRYWIPGIIALFYLSTKYLIELPNTNSPNALFGFIENNIFTLSSTLVVQTFVVAVYINSVNVTPTSSRLRDPFSVEAYSQFMVGWKEAGAFLSGITKPSDKIFTYAMAPASFTDSYIIDQFYFAPFHSKYKEIKHCVADAASGKTCAENYEYILTNYPERPVSHFEFKVFDNLIILKRKE